MENLEFTKDISDMLGIYESELHSIRATNNKEYYRLNSAHANRIVDKVLNELYNETRIDFRYPEELKKAVEACLEEQIVVNDAEFLQFLNRVRNIFDNNIDYENKVLISENVLEGLNGSVNNFHGNLRSSTRNEQRIRQTAKTIVNHMTQVLNNYGISVYSLQDFMLDAAKEEVSKYQDELDEYQIDFVGKKVYEKTQGLLEHIYELSKPKSETYDELARQFK